MNIDRLIAAAKEIDRKAKLQEEHTIRLQQLASQARAYSQAGNMIALRAVQDEAKSMSMRVVDFGDAINELRAALNAK